MRGQVERKRRNTVRTQRGRRTERLQSLVLGLSISASVLFAGYGCGDSEVNNLLGDIPATLADTGLYEAGTPDTVVSGAIEYQPLAELWVDGASKRRWLLLPEGEVVDTSDMDAWEFPVGTKVWKEMSQGGERLETRLLWKREEGWLSVSYLWDDAGTEANAVPGGAENIRGTEYDVPSQPECDKCHDRGVADHVLGFDAILLSDPALAVSVESLGEDGVISDVPEEPIVIPGTDLDKEALLYLHSNCGGCHNKNSDVQDIVQAVFQLNTQELATLEETPPYVTTLNRPTNRGVNNSEINRIIRGGSPETSAVPFRMNSRETNIGMPPLASDLIDTDGLAMIQAWIDTLPAPAE